MADSTPKKILLVEDNEMNIELFTLLLKRGGFDVLTATTAREGVNQAQAWQPDLILMDIALPDMDGLQAVAIIKQDPQNAGVPVIALTAHAMSGDRQKALDSGCAGYITKPVDTREFARTVSSYL